MPVTRQPASYPTDSAEAPRLLIRCGWPRDLLTWLAALPSLLIFGGLVAGFVGIFALVTTLLLSGQELVAWPIGAVAFLWASVSWTRSHFGVSNEEHRFYDDRVISFVKPEKAELRGRSKMELVTIPFESIGSLVLRKRGIAQVLFGIPGREDRARLELNLPRLSATDQFDSIVEWIEEATKDHLFAIEDAEGRRYSRSWSPEERFEELGTTAGDARLDSFHDRATLTIDGEQLAMVYGGFSTVNLFPNAEASGTPIFGAYADPMGGVPEIRVVSENGMILSTTTMAPVDRVEAALGDGHRLSWNTRTGTVYLDEEELGHLIGDPLEARFVVTKRQPTVLVVVVMLICSFFPRYLTREPILAAPQRERDRERP